LEGFVTVHDEN